LSLRGEGGNGGLIVDVDGLREGGGNGGLIAEVDDFGVKEVERSGLRGIENGVARPINRAAEAVEGLLRDGWGGA